MLKRVFFIFLFTLIALNARENPFVPLDSSKSIGKATTINDTRTFFDTQSINLPSTARILKSVELHFQNLDGSIKSKVVNIDKNIDWHETLVLQKEYNAPKIKIQQQKDMQTNKTPMIKEEPRKSFRFFNTLDIDLSKKSIWIRTKDKKVRDFLVTNPYKIVLDFKKDISFRTKVFKADIEPFKNIVIGNHSGYYRVVIELDGQYRYSIVEDNKGYFIKLK